MKQRITLPYALNDENPMHLAFFSDRPLNFLEDLEINGKTYEIQKIAKIEIFKMKGDVIVPASLFPKKDFSRTFCVDSVDVMLESYGLTGGSNVMYLHVVDER